MKTTATNSTPSLLVVITITIVTISAAIDSTAATSVSSTVTITIAVLAAVCPLPSFGAPTSHDQRWTGRGRRAHTEDTSQDPGQQQET
jgi:hypothetical protein